MPKSADAFRTISEVADWLGTPAHVLRFWESKFSQVRPVKRAGGRRYYRPADMELLGGIKRLLHEEGMTIKGVQKLLRDRGTSHVAAMSPPLDDLAVPLEAEIVQLKPRPAPEAPQADLAPITPPDGGEAGAPAAAAMRSDSDQVEGHATEVASEAAPDLTEDPAPFLAPAAEEATTNLFVEAEAESLPESPPDPVPGSPADSVPAWAMVPQDPDEEAFLPAPGLLSQLAARRAPLPTAIAAEALALAERLAALR